MSIDKQSVSWPGWETVQLIGRGSFGAVYEIHRDIFGDIEKAALKVISIPQNASDIDEMYSDGYDEESITSTFKSHLKSIVSEYSMMRKMNGCANIVNCDDVRYVQHDDGIGWDIFIKMELLTPLTKALPTEVPEEIVIKIAKDICTALELCKKHEIIHRDIKPQNIFVSPNGDYKLGDFGIAKTVEKTMGGTKIGTYKYMAPEVYNNKPYGSAADIYSLGLVLYWLLNERRMPFLPLPPTKLSAGMDEAARNRRLSGEQFAEPRNGSKELKAIVMKACAYNVADRYTSASDMLLDLNQIGQEHPLLTGTVPVIPASSPASVNRTEPEDEDQTVGVFGKAPSDNVVIPDGQLEEGTVGLFFKPVTESVHADSETANVDSPAEKKGAMKVQTESKKDDVLTNDEKPEEKENAALEAETNNNSTESQPADSSPALKQSKGNRSSRKKKFNWKVAGIAVVSIVVTLLLTAGLHGRWRANTEDFRTEPKDLSTYLEPEKAQAVQKQLSQINICCEGELLNSYTLHYNDNNELVKADVTIDGRKLEFTYTYDSSGRLIEANRGDYWRYFDNDEYIYNSSGQLSRYNVYWGGGELSYHQYAYEYDPQGNLQTEKELYPAYDSNEMELGCIYNYSYVYDDQGRVSERHGHVNWVDNDFNMVTEYGKYLYSESVEIVKYTYDSEGRVASKQEINIPKTMYNSSGHPNLVLNEASIEKYSYDYLPFVASGYGNSHCTLTLNDIMGHELFSLQVDNESIVTDDAGYVISATHTIDDETSYTYEFLYGMSDVENDIIAYTPFVEQAISEELFLPQGNGMLYDMDGDGVQELIMVHQKSEMDGNVCYYACCVYGIENGQVYAKMDELYLNPMAGAPKSYVGIVEYNGEQLFLVHTSNTSDISSIVTDVLYSPDFSKTLLTIEKNTEGEYLSDTIVKENSFKINGIDCSETEYESTLSAIEYVDMIDDGNGSASGYTVSGMPLNELLNYLEANS